MVSQTNIQNRRTKQQIQILESEMQHMWHEHVGNNSVFITQNLWLACAESTSGCRMNKNYTPHDYKFAKALQESLAQDVENKKSLFKNPEDIELAKRIIRGQE
jgi:hypothetical protein